MFEHVPQPYCIPLFVLVSCICCFCLAPHTCKALLSFVLFSPALLSLTLLVVPAWPRVVVMTLIFTDGPEISFFFYLHSRFVLVFTLERTLPPPHIDRLRAVRPWDAANCVSKISRPPDIGNVLFYIPYTQYRAHALSLSLSPAASHAAGTVTEASPLYPLVSPFWIQKLVFILQPLMHWFLPRYTRFCRAFGSLPTL